MNKAVNKANAIIAGKKKSAAPAPAENTAAKKPAAGKITGMHVNSVISAMSQLQSYHPELRKQIRLELIKKVNAGSIVADQKGDELMKYLGAKLDIADE